MKIKVNQSELEEALNKVRGAVASNKTMPILQGIYVTHDTILATDLEIGIKTSYDAEVEEKSAVVFPQNVVNIVKQLPKNENVVISVDDNYKADIKCNGSEFQLSCYNPEEFPQLPQVENPKTIELDTQSLSETIHKTKMATSDDDTQPGLTGIHLGEGYATSTNTYRLANFKTNFELENEIILPHKSAKEVENVAQNGNKVNIEYSNNYIKFDFDNEIIISRLIEGKFPNWRQVMPDKHNLEVTTRQKALRNAVKRAKIVSDVVTLSVKNDTIEITADDGEGGHAHEVVECTVDGSEQKINVDASYLLDVLKVLDKAKVKIRLIDKLNPLMIVEENLRYLVMPVRKD